MVSYVPNPVKVGSMVGTHRETNLDEATRILHLLSVIRRGCVAIETMELTWQFLQMSTDSLTTLLTVPSTFLFGQNLQKT